MQANNQKIQIKDLVLWDENARFPDSFQNQDESELIKSFVAKSEFKIKQLIESIVKDFDLPQLEKIVVFNDEGKNIVYEGNRRVTAYKLLCNPKLTVDTKLSNFLSEQKKILKINDSYELDCIVSADKEIPLRYIDRKHAKGNNEVGWQETERARYKIIRGRATQNELIKSEIAKIIKNLDIPKEYKEQILGSGYVSTFFRIVLSTASKIQYGISITTEGELKIVDPEFNDKLKVIISNVLNKKDFGSKKIDSRSLNTKDKISDYLKSVKSIDVKKVEEEIKENTKTNLFSETVVVPNGKVVNKSKPIPKGLFTSKDVPFKINNDCLRVMYEELKNIEVSEFPNATHDLLRSFLECSLIVFFKNNGEYIKIEKNSNHNPTLSEMLTFICNKKSQFILDENVIETIKQVKTDYNEKYSLERLNMVNHNENWVSVEKDVRSAWAKLQSLFKIILS